MPARSSLMSLALCLLAGCGPVNTPHTGQESAPPPPSEPEAAPDQPDRRPDGAEPGIDVEALLDSYGFVRCERLMPHPDLTDERRQEIYRAMVDAGLGDGAALDPGHRVWLHLFVLDEPTLSALAEIAEPSEVCLSGQDPNDHVAAGPQAADGPGWRWIGAAGTETDVDLGLITTSTGYDALWSAFTSSSPPPEGPQPAVDFDKEVVLTISTGGTGTSSGPCGHRFDGYTVEDGTIVVDWFTPGGDSFCEGAYFPGTVAVALDLAIVGPPPPKIALRTGPRHDPGRGVTVPVGAGVLGWPLARLLNEAVGIQNAPPVSSDLADAVACRLFHGAADTPISAGPEVPPEVVEAAVRSVETVETLLDEGVDAAVPLRLEHGGLEWIMGTPSDTPACGS